MNLRPSGYEPDELPDCSTPRRRSLVYHAAQVPPYVERLPKIHLHCHLEGTMRATTFLDLTDRYGLGLRYLPGSGSEVPEPSRDIEHAFAFADFREFLLLFAAVSRSLATPDDYARLAAEFVQDAKAQHVLYGEMFVSPSVWSFFHPKLDVIACFEAIHAEFAREPSMEFRMIVDLTRNFGAAGALETAELAAGLTRYGVIGVGLGGDEARFPAELFADAFAFARSEGLHTVAHAGEADGAESVRSAIEALGAERIGHGVRALEHPEVAELLRSREIVCEVCPTSNYRTGVVGPDEAHPLGAMLEAELPLIIDADDPTLFGTSISQEYALVAKAFGPQVLTACIDRAISASFADSADKQRLRVALHEAITATNPESEAL